MKQRMQWAAAIFLSAALLLSTTASAVGTLSAHSAILMDAATGQVLYEKNSHEKSLIASTTKIMTGLLAAESGRLSETVIIPPEAVGIEGSSLYLKAGERLTVEQLLYGLMLHSGNDAAVALALHLSGNVEDFVDRMNEKAAELGLTETHFANPNGLDDEGNYGTAHDLAVLAAAALENEVFRQVVSTKTYTVGQRQLTNHNKLLWRYEGAMGVKTGFTKAAGRLLVSAAERQGRRPATRPSCWSTLERQGRRLIAVTINAPDDWNDHSKLLDDGFSRLTAHTALTDGTLLGSVPIVGGTAETVTCRVRGDLSCALLPEETPTVTICLPRMAFAPVRAGDTAGWVELRVGEAVLARTELIYDTAAVLPDKPQSFLERLLKG